MSITTIKPQSTPERNTFRFIPFFVILLLILAFMGFQLYFLVQTIIEY